MKKTLYSAVGALSILSLLLAPCAIALADNTVSATVQVKTISVAVTDGEVSYGVLAASATQDTLVTGVNDPQTATNDGNVNEDFTISGADTTGCVWALDTTQDADQYYHKFSVNAGSSWTPLTTTLGTPDEIALASDIAPVSDEVFDLKIGVPSSSTCSTTATSVITVTASEHS